MATKNMLMFLRPDVDTEEGYRIYLLEEAHRWFANTGDIKLDEVEIYYPEPKLSQQELRFKAVKTMQEEQEKARLDAAVKVAQLQKHIDKLLVLTYNPEGGSTYDGN